MERSRKYCPKDFVQIIELIRQTLSLILIFIFFASCRDYSLYPDEPLPTIEQKDLIASRDVVFNINNFIVRVDSIGQISQDDTRVPRIWPGSVYNSGFWVAGEEFLVVKSNTVGITNSNEKSNYTVKYKDKKLGVYLITPTVFKNPDNKFPIENGFPVDIYGKPKMFGDAMTWASFHSDTTKTDPLLKTPLKRLRVNQIVYGYKNSELSRCLFIRYDMISEHLNISYAHAGFWADVDISSNNDYVGYDTVNDITYTYTNSPSADKLFYVIGYTILQTPYISSTKVGIYSHRYMDISSSDLEFGETINSSLGVYNCLRGLSNTGKKIYDPITKKETRFALTGNPITKEGWLDSPRDSRQLLSTGYFHIYSNQTVIVLWVIESGQTLFDAVTKLKLKVAEVRDKRNLWAF